MINRWKNIYHGGLSQWGRSNRPRIRPGSVKSLNAPWELSKLAFRRDNVKKIDPCRMLVWLGRRTVQNMFWSIQAVGRPVQTGQVLFEFKFTTAQSDFGSQCYKVYEKKFAFYWEGIKKAIYLKFGGATSSKTFCIPEVSPTVNSDSDWKYKSRIYL